MHFLKTFYCIIDLRLKYNIFVADFAVGAPYDGPNQRGAVYIFLGSRDGVMKKPSQV